ncbi:hypothetical protein BDV06DRAFT_230414 [Aspergillus oleicola]
MLLSILRSLPQNPLRRKWTPLSFTNPKYGIVLPHQKIEEETIPGYVASRYYPTRIGEVLKDRYQVIGKLGFGLTSTVWLARDMDYRTYVTLKIFVDSASMGKNIDDELQIYERIQNSSKFTGIWPWRHPGRDAIRSLVDCFDIDGDGAEHKHRCLVHPPLFESVWDFLHRNPIQRLPAPILAVTLKRLFQALDYLHSECRVIHTDLSATNILFTYMDDTSYKQLEQEELHSPSPRKEIDGKRSIYLSRELQFQPDKMGAPVLVDFGSAVPGDMQHTEDVQPNQYRAPEVILEIPWSYEIDIWNAGCMIWNIFQGGSAFSGHDAEFNSYRSRAHLADMINLLGPPPASLLSRGRRAGKFFTESGEFRDKWLLKGITPLEERQTGLDGDREDKELFLRFMRKMLRWEPGERATAGELVGDEWVVKHSS